MLITEGIVLALIVAVPAMLSPLLMALLTNRNRRQEKAEDYARQDIVAARLVKQNAAVAESTKVVNNKLDVIHTLVNSNMTAAMQAELDARKETLVLLKAAHGLKPGEEGLVLIQKATEKIALLEATLSDRLKQSELVSKQLDAQSQKETE